ncbi:hypothetical protein [Xanthomonas bundabergensis]|uniref:hypothetical protein n=1 Tax=Xanthomonas bundabergensis TaxID=3160842 RepID=UPI003519AF96
MTAARRTTTPLSTADTAPHGGANHDASGYTAKAPAETAHVRSGASNVYQHPLSAGGADGEQRARAQRKQLATGIVAVGSIAAIATLALIAWRRARR